MRHFPRGDDLAVVPPIKKDENRKEATLIDIRLNHDAQLML